MFVNFYFVSIKREDLKMTKKNTYIERAGSTTNEEGEPEESKKKESKKSVKKERGKRERMRERSKKDEERRELKLTFFL